MEDDMSPLFTEADVKAGQDAIGGFFGPDGNFDYYAAREAVAAVAPAIAARALREAARYFFEDIKPNGTAFNAYRVSWMIGEMADKIEAG